MKRLIFLLVIYLNCGVGSAEVNPAVAARWKHFINLAEQKEYQKAVEEGVKVSTSLTQEKAYQEAFATCRELDALIGRVEKESKKPQYQLRYLVAKERLRMYTRLKKADQSSSFLELLHSYVEEMKSDSLTEDLWLTQANYYQQVGMVAKSLESYNKFFHFRTLGKDDSAKDSCYREMITYTERANNASLAIAVRKLYTNWQDSIKGVENAKKMELLAQEKENFNQELNEKNSKIESQSIVLLICCVILLLLVVVLIYSWLMLARKKLQERRLRQALVILESTNAQKSNLICNIAAQLEPSLLLVEEGVRKSLPIDSPAILSVQALKCLISDIERFTTLEGSKEERYDAESVSISHLCNEVMDEVKPLLKEGVTFVVNTPSHVMLKTNREAVKKILLHLLVNASIHTLEGRITLEFKKRRADLGHFVITDTGTGIPADEIDTLFIPFAKVRNLLAGNALGLPTCAVVAYKLNGTLFVDVNYKKGSRFILELNV
ncbi:MAG: sensor histidine kinase [Phocaeicola sp.]